ncbi:unnamed protein product, partial [Allacma fusca]
VINPTKQISTGYTICKTFTSTSLNFALFLLTRESIGR